MFLVLIGGAIAAFMVWRHINKRGKSFVRAVAFLDALDRGSSVEDANQIASHLFTSGSNPDTDRSAINNATAIAEAKFGGKQLPVIHAARRMGYCG